MISTKGRYALRFLADLAQHQNDGYVPLKEIAQRQSLSKKYLEIIVSSLVKAGLLESASGKRGGYRLKAPASDISAAQVLEIMEGTLAPVACLECPENTCPRKETCPTLSMWKKYDVMTRSFFSSISIQDLADGKEI